MPSSSSIAFVLVLVASVVAGQEPEPARLLDSHRQLSEKTAAAIEGLRSDRAEILESIENARRRSREATTRAESRPSTAPDGTTGPDPWAATAPAREALQAEVRALLLPWLRASRDLLAGEAARAEAAANDRAIVAIASPILEAGLGLLEPPAFVDLLVTESPALARLLGRAADPEARLRLLAILADRLAATPGTSDIDVLEAVIAFAERCHADREEARALLDTLSGDLILVFTERAADGVTPSGSPHHRPGRCGDRGFRAELRDDGDQVRHFCWALRMFAIATDLDAREKLLRLKERLDAARRDQPINQADLALNRIAREIVTTFLAPPSDAAERVRLSELVRRRLAAERR